MARILVAEDDLALRLLYRLWLEHAGHAVVEAADGRQAIELVELGPPPEAAVLDVDMPYVDGLSVCRYLRLRDPGLPIVVATGIEDIQPAALAAGATTVLAKPCDRDELLAALNTAHFAHRLRSA